MLGKGNGIGMGKERKEPMADVGKIGKKGRYARWGEGVRFE